MTSDLDPIQKKKVLVITDRSSCDKNVSESYKEWRYSVLVGKGS